MDKIMGFVGIVAAPQWAFITKGLLDTILFLSAALFIVSFALLVLDFSLKSIAFFTVAMISMLAPFWFWLVVFLAICLVVLAVLASLILGRINQIRYPKPKRI